MDRQVVAALLSDASTSDPSTRENEISTENQHVSLCLRCKRNETYDTTAVWRRYADVLIRDVSHATATVDGWNGEPAVSVPGP